MSRTVIREVLSPKLLAGAVSSVVIATVFGGFGAALSVIIPPSGGAEISAIVGNMLLLPFMGESPGDPIAGHNNGNRSFA